MIHNRFSLICFVVVAFTTCAERASAQTFQLAWYDATGTNPISLVNVAPSSSFTATVYMTQTSGTANYLGTVGMHGFSVALDVGTASAPVSINLTSSIVRNSQFDDAPANGIQLGTVTSSFSAARNDPGVPVFAPGSTNRILMGTVTFQTGSIGAQTLTASNGPLGNIGGTPDFIDMNVSSGLLSVVVAVPEPSTVLLIGAGTLGLCRAIVRRRKSAAAPALAA